MLPLEIDDLTPEFFTSALERGVEKAEMLDHHSGTTGRARFALHGEPGVPTTVFVKLAPFDKRQREFVTSVGMGVAEARFYRDLGGEVPVRIPHAWFASVEDERYVMVFEDLEASGCWFPTPRDDDIAARGLDIVEQMVALHARYWDSPRFDRNRDLAWLADRGTGQGDGGAMLVRMAVDALGEQLDTNFHRVAEMYLANVPAIMRLWNSGPRTLVHGDPHLGNMFVDAEGGNRTGFLDWALVGRSPGLRDVAYALCNSIPADVRREHERTWLDRYSARLAEQGVTLAIDDAWRQYRLFALYSWVAATSTAAMGSKWQPLHVGLGGTRRATAACEDLNCVELVEGLLAQT